LFLRLERNEALSAAELEETIADLYERRMLIPGQGTLQFKGSQDRVLDLPLFEDQAPGYRIQGDMVLIANRATLLQKTRLGNTDQRAFVDTVPGFSAGLIVNAKAASGGIRTLLTNLAKRDNWDSRSNAQFFSENVVSLLDMLGFVDEIRWTRSVVDGVVLEHVRYSLSSGVVN
jgi:hypothetical protein